MLTFLATQQGHKTVNMHCLNLYKNLALERIIFSPNRDISQMEKNLQSLGYYMLSSQYPPP